MIPEYLLRHSHLLKVYIYLLRLTQNGYTSTMLGDSAIPLGPYEHAELLETIGTRTCLREEEVKVALLKLQTLHLLTIIRDENPLHVKLDQIVLPQSITQAQSQALEYNDCWLHDFILEDYEWIKTNLSPKSLENARRVMTMFEKFIGAKRLSQLRAEDLEILKSMRKSQQPKVSDATINMDVRTIKAVMERAVTRGRLARNPFKDVKQIRCPKKKIPYFSPEQMGVLLHTIREPWLKDIVSFAVCTCMRRGEILNLRWKNVHLDDRFIEISSSDVYQVKQGQLRHAPLSNQALEILMRQRRDSEWAFADGEGQRFSGDYVCKKFKQYTRECGLPDELHFHSLRATGASWMASDGVPIYNVKEIMGHASVRTTEPYASLKDQSLRDAVERIALPSEKEREGLDTVRKAKTLILPISPSTVKVPA